MRNIERDTRNAICEMRNIERDTRNAICEMRNIEHEMRNAICEMRWAKCDTRMSPRGLHRKGKCSCIFLMVPYYDRSCFQQMRDGNAI